jgi:hypothetical protein
MSAITSYNTLVSAITQALEDDSQETANYIPTAIGNAEYRLLRETDFTGIDITTVVTATAGNRLVNKPSGYRLGKAVRYTTSAGLLQDLKKNTVSYAEKYWPFANTSVGNPKYYADYSVSSFLLAPTPDSDYPITVTHVVKPQGVSAGNQTNTYTQWMPDALFHASMSEMADFSRNNELKQYHEQSYINVVLGINNEARRARRDEGMAPLSQNVNVNTLKGEN